VSHVVIYSTRFCPFCVHAKALLKRKNVKFKDIAIDGNATLRQEMIKAAGATSVPQIWIGNQHIGGCDELVGLDRRGLLDDMLANSGQGAGNE
jgi:glutaredoxin 3|tara:strand:+ start:562 stop:840 length:279 start_codon:yes stop_codon:yes gene_type:complete